MPLAGQMTVENPARHWVHQVDMVENDPGRSDIPAVLSGEWWGLSGGRDATIMVTNASGNTVTADVFLAFGGKEHKLDPLVFNGNQTKLLSVAEMLGTLDSSASEAPEGRITIIQRGPNPALVAQGRVTDPVTGFSTTLEFPDPARQHASALHASGVPIGTPAADSPFAGDGYFTPHVIASNLTDKPQSVSITLEYPKSSAWKSANGPGGPAAPLVRFTGRIKKGIEDPNEALNHPSNQYPSTLTGQFRLTPLTVAPNSTVDFSLAAFMNQLPPTIPYASVRIQYTGPPGSLIAQVSSVDEKQDLVVDAKAENEGNNWAGSGANPWQVDSQTNSILFLTDEGDQSARIGFQVTANGVHYYLTSLELAPHETRAINIRALRDMQAADFKGNRIPARAADGSVDWIRLDGVPVMGRMMVIQKGQGLASSYDCYDCCCPATATSLQIAPGIFDLIPLGILDLGSTGVYRDCDGVLTYYDETLAVSWSSNDPSIIEMVSGTHGEVEGVSFGSTKIVVTLSPPKWLCDGGLCVHAPPVILTANATGNVVSATITVNLGPPPSSRSSSLSSGDSLLFPTTANACTAGAIGAQACSNGWFWQVEVAGVVSNDASKWVVSQTANSWSYAVTYTNGTIQTTGSSTPSDDTPSSQYVQQTAGTNSVYWIDSPGYPFSSTLAGVTDESAFTSKVCSTVTMSTCRCVDWQIHLVGTSNTHGNPTLDTADSSATITKASYACSP